MLFRSPDPTLLVQYEREPPDQANTLGFGISFPLPLWNRNKGGILAAQSVDPDGTPDHKERQRRAQRGGEILDRLEEVRRGLLMGAIPKDRLQELAHLVREKRERGADPIVSRLLDEIELRAEVELAKLSRRAG